MSDVEFLSHLRADLLESARHAGRWRRRSVLVASAVSVVLLGTGGIVLWLREASSSRTQDVIRASSPRGITASNGGGVTAPRKAYYNAMAFSSWRNGWIVGARPRPPWRGQYGVEAGLARRWNGVRWVELSLPRPGISSWLNGVLVTSDRDAWAVGAWQKVPNQRLPLVLHWDGVRWSQVPLPDKAGRGELLGVGLDADGSVWAVGRHDTREIKPLGLRRHAGLWRIEAVPGALPAISGAFRTHQGLGVVSENRFTPTTLVALRSDSGWQVLASPDFDRANAPQAVIVTPDGAIWAGGSYSQSCSGGSSTSRPLISQWNGSAWRLARLPPALTGSIELIAASSSADAWAIGQTFPSGGLHDCSTTSYPPVIGSEHPGMSPLLLHWDGAFWRRVPVLQRMATWSITAAADVGPNDAWIGGYRVADGAPIVAHWNGHDWQETNRSRGGG